MAWSPPRTWAAGETVTSDLMNAHIRDNMVVLSAIYDTATGKIQAINSTYVKNLAGLTQILNINVTPGSNSSVAETDLITYSMPGGTLANTGESIRITSWGTTTNSVNAKIVKQYFGTAVLHGFSGMMANSVAHNWIAVSEVFRTGAATQTAWSTFDAGASDAATSNTNQETTAPTQTLSGSLTIKTTGQGGAGSEITCLGQIVEIFQQ